MIVTRILAIAFISIVLTGCTPNCTEASYGQSLPIEPWFIGAEMEQSDTTTKNVPEAPKADCIRKEVHGDH